MACLRNGSITAKSASMWYIIAFLALFAQASEAQNFNSSQLATINSLANKLLTGLYLTVDDLLLNDTGINPYDEVTFWVRNQKLNQTVQLFANDADVQSKVDLSKPCQFLIHGWIDSIKTTWAQNILNRK